MHARAIGRWVGRAALFATLGLGIWAMIGLAGAGATTANQTSVAKDIAVFAETDLTPMEFDWN